MGASHSTKLHDPLIIEQSSTKSQRFVKTSTTSEGYSCYYYYEGCHCDQFLSNSSTPVKAKPSSPRKKSSLKRPHSEKTSSKRVHFKPSGNRRYTISPQKEELPIAMNSPFRGLRRTSSGNSNSYPYPRTHTTVMVIPSCNRLPSGPSSRTGEWSSTSSIADDSPTSSLSALNFDVSNTGPSYGFDKRRPPLNRAIPPIPESKSNESIMSQASKSLAGTPCEPKQPTLELVQEVVEDKSVVIENKMAQSLAAKTATNIKPPNPTTLSGPVGEFKSKLKQPKEIVKQTKKAHSHADPPKSPLMSMAHSVRSRLTKLGTRFGRSDSHSRSPIRSSTSLISMPNQTAASKIKMAKSSSMEATRIPPSISTATKAFPNHDTAVSNDAPVIRSQITLIPSPCRSPRPFIPEPTSKSIKMSDEKISLPSTIQEVAEPTTITSDTERSPSKSKGVTSPVSAATTTSSNTDTIYSSRISSSTRHITSPDWSEASNAKTTAPSIITTTAATNSVVALTSPEKDKSHAENIPPPTSQPSLAAMEEPKMVEKLLTNTSSKKAPSKDSTKVKTAPATPSSQKSDKVSKTPKLVAKFGFGGNKAVKTQKVIPSPKVKAKKGSSLVIKGTLPEEKKKTEEIIKAPRKSLSFEAQTKPVEVRRNSEMKLIKRIEKSFIPLIPYHHDHNSSPKVDNNKNINMRSLNVHSVNMRNRRAPLAEFESTRVENSPAVELPPIGFDRLTSSPGQRRRAQTAAAANARSTTVIHDANGNVISSSEVTTAQAAPTNLSALDSKENNNHRPLGASDLDNHVNILLENMSKDEVIKEASREKSKKWIAATEKRNPPSRQFKSKLFFTYP